MCVVSMIGDHYFKKYFPDTTHPDTILPGRYDLPFPPANDQIEELKKKISSMEDEFRKEMLEMKELLKKAIQYDKMTNQPNCQNEEKILLLKKVAELVGVDLNELFESK